MFFMQVDTTEFDKQNLENTDILYAADNDPPVSKCN